LAKNEKLLMEQEEKFIEGMKNPAKVMIGKAIRE